MKVINTWADMLFLQKSRLLPKSFLMYLEQEWKELMYAYCESERTEDTSLEHHGSIIVLEPGDNLPKGIGKSYWAEYVDKIQLEGMEVYRMYVMEAEDYGKLYYSIVGTLDDESEAVLQENAEMNER